MTDLPLLGAALRIYELETYLDWLVQDARDLEIQGFHAPAVLELDWKAEAAKVKALLANHKGRQGMHGTASVPLASNDPGVRALAQERLNHNLDVAAEIGLTQVVIHSPYIHWDQENLYRYPHRRAEKLADFIATMEPLVARAESLGVQFVIENIEDRDPAIRRDIVTHFNSASLKLSIDTGHAYYAHYMGGAPMVDMFVRAAGEDLHHLHLQDADGFADRHWAIGDGTVPWAAVFEELAMISSNPRLIIEIRNKTDVVRSAEHLANIGLAR